MVTRHFQIPCCQRVGLWVKECKLQKIKTCLSLGRDELCPREGLLFQAKCMQAIDGFVSRKTDPYSR